LTGDAKGPALPSVLDQTPDEVEPIYRVGVEPFKVTAGGAQPAPCDQRYKAAPSTGANRYLATHRRQSFSPIEEGFTPEVLASVEESEGGGMRVRAGFRAKC
jgi:hypothetical protein